ncbi:hypothetical protein [Frigoribacterium sp. CFBP 13712]|uniref:hypothetical protein n=1 Tax=Frigoribacterium sp. CFBP 13712 TaxID=2775309 RepID=UPI00177C246D|nr:hypothetical protein [Frigoribacterium sp. CFBP 13712]MBD8704912.1 hypothetical protein [Frigoribacterium sp. CFBP 13712]
MPTIKESPFSWLPNHQLHVLASLGYVDDLLDDAARLLRDHSRAGAFVLESVMDGSASEVRIAGLRPIPPAVSRLTADTLNNLRNVLEHTLFAAVEHDLGRTMTTQEARSIEVPAAGTEAAFNAWLNDKRRLSLPPLCNGSPLAEALRQLQPFTWQGEDTSPLQLIVEHTNASKHRAPAVAQTQLGEVTPDLRVPGLVIPPPTGQPAAVGDLVASGPQGTHVGLDVWPTVTIRRPASGQWKVLQLELSYIEEWVRLIALPALLGLKPNEVLRATTDVRAEVDNLREAAAVATDDPALTRNTRILVAEGVMRPGMLDLLLPVCRSRKERAAVRSWVDSQTDEQIITRHDRLSRAATDEARAREACRQLVRIAVRRA